VERVRTRAIDDLLAGHLRSAVLGFEWVLAERPSDLVSAALRETSEDLLRMEEGPGNFAGRGATSKRVMEAPAGYALHAPVPIPPAFAAGEAPELHVAVETGWEASLSSRHGRPPGVDFGDWSGRPWRPRTAYLHPDHIAYPIEPRSVGVAAREGSPVTVFDLSVPIDAGGVADRYQAPFRSVSGAEVVGRTLLVSLGWWVGDAKKPVVDSQGRRLAPSGFLAAIDLDSGAVRWWSEPRTAGPFLVSGAFIIAGIIGPSHETGTLSVLELATGRTRSRVDVPFPPSRFVRDEGSILALDGRTVRAVVTTSVPLSPPPPPELDPVPQEDRRVERCAVLRAVAAIDRGDHASAASILDAHQGLSTPLLRGVRAAASALARELSRPLSAAITLRTPVIVAPLPSGATFRGPEPPAPPRPVRLVRSRVRVLTGQTDGVNDFQAYDPPVTLDVPKAYGPMKLLRTVAAGSGGLLFYGNQYVAVLEGREVVSLLDVDALGLSNARGALLRGALRGGAVILGNLDFITALDGRTGALVWRSAPHTSLTNFVVLGDSIVSAYGWDPEKSELFVLRADTGAIVARHRFTGKPEALIVEKDELSVFTEQVITTFKILP
jgi:hypothetical protein